VSVALPAADDVIAALAEYVSIPSVSAVSDPTTMRAAADWLAGHLGWANGRVDDTTAGNPIVRGEWHQAPGAPTVLVYGHYDVQPPGSLDEWATPPYELTRGTHDGEDVVRGRGSTDDKGPVLIALAPMRAHVEGHGALPLNVTFLFEGEEEIGSPHLSAYVRDHADELACDLVVSADGAMWRPTEPSIALASKGMASATIEVTAAGQDLHSGRYGGTVANPAVVLARIVASLHDKDARVAIDRFYDGVRELTPQRRAEIAAVEFSEEDWATSVGAPDTAGEAGYSTLERLWERPTCEVTGLDAGGKYSVIPHIASAHVAMRLVHEQDPAAVLAALEKHVLAQPTPGAQARVLPDAGAVPAYSVEPEHPAIRAATAALASVYPGQDVLPCVIAGTLPCTALFEAVLGAKTLFFSFSTSDELLHAPNEYLRVSRIDEGMRAWAALLEQLAIGLVAKS